MPLLNAKITKIENCAYPALDGAFPGITLKDIPSLLKTASDPNARASLLCDIRSLDEAGDIRISFECSNADLRVLDAGGPHAVDLCNSKPALWNVAAYDEEWLTHPEYNDFMKVDSPAYYRKKLQAAIYSELLAPYLPLLSPGASILDAGAGVGRMVKCLSATGAELHLADSSEKALKVAWRELCTSDVANYDIHRVDASDLSSFEDDSFDLCLAIELLCYLNYPAAAIAELTRVCKPGGLVIFSVENKAGAVLGDSNLSIDDIASLSESDTLFVPGYCYTKYYTRESSEALATNAGLDVVEITGCHFTADGPFDSIVNEDLLSIPGVMERFLAAERACRAVPELERIGRAWFVVAKNGI